jgi:predicted phosphodiesterase
MKESKYFLQRLDDLDIPVSYVIGNHDHHLMIMAQEQNLLDRASRGEFFPAYSTSMNWSSTINGLHLDMHYPMYISRTPSVSVLFTHGHHLDGIQGFSLQIVEHIRRLSGDEVTVADLERMMAYTYESIYLSSYMEEIVDVEERIWGASLIFDKVKAGLLKSLRATPVQRQYEPIMQFMKDRRIGHVDCFVYGDTHRAGVYRRDGGFLAANSGCFTTDGIQTAEQTPNTYLIIDGEDVTLRQLGCEEPLYAGEI